ncbi:MAG TPA: hypothetical protein PK926_01305 [Spirochaetota bacterium]|nr:hypothetical protein [Spirochaetota bacterium]HPI88105.1 hypothetical protein [Spirochaetota bacterium]HPR46410.1 hypothetical protein [Spirochaetota bacterium]
MPEDKSSLKKHFNQAAVDIGTAMLSLQMSLASFVMELLDVYEDRSADFDINIPHMIGEDFTVMRLTKIYYDREQDLVYVLADDQTLVWTDLNILAQDMVATFLHMQFTADNIFGNLS